MDILIVKDQRGISDFLKQELEEEGFIVDVAQDGIQGLNKSVANPYSIILLDWMLPGLSGFDLCQRIRLTDKLTPIIFLTTRDTLEDTILGLKAGANDYIKKPFSFEDASMLLILIGNLLSNVVKYSSTSSDISMKLQAILNSRLCSQYRIWASVLQKRI